MVFSLQSAAVVGVQLMKEVIPVNINLAIYWFLEVCVPLNNAQEI